MPTIVLTINGTSRAYERGTLDIIRRANSRGTLSVNFKSIDGSVRPVADQEIIVTADGTRIFGGLIDEPEERGISENSVGLGRNYEITAVDFNVYADRRFVFADLPSQTLKTSLQTLDDYLTPYGITLDGAQVNGPVLPRAGYNWQMLSDIFNDLCALAEPLYGSPQAVIWEIDFNKVLRAYGVLESGHTAPFNITDSSASTQIVGDIVVRPARTDFANYVHLMIGEGQKAVIDQLGTGNGSQTAFQMNYPMAANEGRVNLGGTIVGSVIGGTISGGTDESLGVSGSGATWIWDPVTNIVTRTSAVANGVAVLMPYTVTYPARVFADAGAAMSARVERMYSRPDVFDIATGFGLANAILQQTNQTFKEISYTTRTAGLQPGQTQTITLTKQGLSGSHLITEVRTYDSPESELWYDVKGIVGTTSLPERWMEIYKLWAGTGAGSGGGSVTAIVTSGSTRAPYHLGGNSVTRVQSATPTWVAVDVHRVTIDTVARQSTIGTVRGRVIAASGNASLRLWNVTDSVSAGSSSVVTTPTSWTDVTPFAVTLAAGSKVYELQILPTVANVDVGGVGYFE